MKKAFDQTVREIKREVNKKVLKVPRAEQKVLDATSNEPWGPHGSLLADIAQATRNYHEYQMIMTVIWKRVSDTGKNWRHVYKALTVLEYLVGHGSERVIDEIREHAYQISTLSDFQYIDSYGRDQGSNVRKKSQSLVVLVNDKERIQEVRQKAATNRDKFRNASMGGMYGTGSGNYGYDDDCFGSRDDHRNGYGYDDRYGWDGDRYNGDPDDRYGRDGYRDDGYRGRSRSIDERYSSRSRSLDRDRDRAFEDDDQNSTRASGAKANDRSQDGSVSGQQLERKFSEQNLNAPPSYEEAVGETRSPVRSERDGETSVAPATKAPAPITSSPSRTDTTTSVPAPQASAFTPPNASVSSSASFSPPGSIPANKEFDSYDEFDPRGRSVAASTSFNDAGMDLLGSLSDSFSSNPLAIVAVSPTATAPETNASAKCSSGSTFAATASASNGDQPFDDPFGDGPFRALPGADAAPAQSQNIASTPSLVASTNQSSEVPQSINPYGQVPPAMISSFAPQGLPKSDQDTTDILADILPSSGPSPPVASQTGFPHQPAAINSYPTQAGPHEHQKCFPSQVGQPLSQTSFVARNDFPGEGGAMPGFVGQMNSAPQIGFAGQINSAPQSGFAAPSPQPAQPTASSYGNYLQQQAPAAPVHMVSHPTPPVGAITQKNNLNSHSQSSHGNVLSSTLMASQQTLPASTALAIVPQPTEDKFETKSTVWADTLSRGLVNLNISGPKTNPLADIGVDFDAINRREKRMEKPTPTSNVTSTITMGKAMGTGSGIGRAGAGVLRSPGNPMAGAGMGMGVAGGYGGGMNQYPMGLNIGMGMNVGPSMGMGMNMGMSQRGAPMQPMGFPPGAGAGAGAGANVVGGYNPMMGRGGGYAQPPYGGGYR